MTPLVLRNVSATSQAKSSFFASSGSCRAMLSSMAAALSQSLAYTSRPVENAQVETGQVTEEGLRDLQELLRGEDPGHAA